MAEFEEREYERPLYFELGASQNRLWSPGQVLEKSIGIDAAFFIESPLPLGLPWSSLPPGVVLSRHWHFFRNDLGIPANRKLPNFRLNAFLQAKRPRYLKTAAPAIRAAGVRGSHWAFEIHDQQQIVLEKLHAKFSGRAIVSYAAPVFHREAQLYRHTIGGTVCANSTFPVPSSLSGHKHWHYKVPGAVGVATTEPEGIENKSFVERLRELDYAESHDEHPSDDWIRHLIALSSGVRDIMENSELPDSFRRARFFTMLRELEAEAAILGESHSWWLPYHTLVVFVATFRLLWFCVE